ncbi:putative RAB18 member RAS oncogene family, partial [Danaus plexippus plexippus]
IIETPGLWESTGSSSNIRVTSEERSQQESSCYDYTCSI